LLPTALVKAQELRPARVGVILHGGPWYAVIDGLRQGLKQLGLVEGKEFVLEIHDTGGDLRTVADTARNLERDKVNLIYTVATSVSLAAKQTTQSVPIVFFAGTNPVAWMGIRTASAMANKMSLMTAQCRGPR